MPFASIGILVEYIQKALVSPNFGGRNMETLNMFSNIVDIAPTHGQPTLPPWFCISGMAMSGLQNQR